MLVLISGISLSIPFPFSILSVLLLLPVLVIYMKSTRSVSVCDSCIIGTLTELFWDSTRGYIELSVIMQPMFLPTPSGGILKRGKRVHGECYWCVHSQVRWKVGTLELQTTFFSCLFCSLSFSIRRCTSCGRVTLLSYLPQFLRYVHEATECKIRIALQQFLLWRILKYCEIGFGCHTSSRQ